MSSNFILYWSNTTIHPNTSTPKCRVGNDDKPPRNLLCRDILECTLWHKKNVHYDMYTMYTMTLNHRKRMCTDCEGRCYARTGNDCAPNHRLVIWPFKTCRRTLPVLPVKSMLAWIFGSISVYRGIIAAVREPASSDSPDSLSLLPSLAATIYPHRVHTPPFFKISRYICFSDILMYLPQRKQ